MTTTDPLDATSKRLGLFARHLKQTLGSAAIVEYDLSDGWASASLEPNRPDALGIAWAEWGTDVTLTTAGGLGGRWELDRTLGDMDFLEDVVRSVVAGRVVEVAAGDRSRVEVTLADGSVVVETGRQGFWGLLPRPGWQRRGRRIQYAPYYD